MENWYALLLFYLLFLGNEDLRRHSVPAWAVIATVGISIGIGASRPLLPEMMTLLVIGMFAIRMKTLGLADRVVIPFVASLFAPAGVLIAAISFLISAKYAKKLSEDAPLLFIFSVISTLYVELLHVLNLL